MKQNFPKTVYETAVKVTLGVGGNLLRELS